jgi:hypothetical protein
MSWNLKKVGNLRDSLKAAVNAEAAPQSIKEEICSRIDGHFNRETKSTTENKLPAGVAVLVESYGHVAEGERPWCNTDEIRIHVRTVPLIDTPLPQS